MANGEQAYQIQDPSAELRALLLSYGISSPPGQFWLTPLVSPVSIVDSRVSLIAESSPEIPDNFNTAGILTNPAANTRLANTGQLAAGNYSFKVYVSMGSSTINMRCIRRNAADTADITAMLVKAPWPEMRMIEFVFPMNLNERLVVENSGAPGAGVDTFAIIWWKRL